MSSATKRACDACHRRKVRCDGSNPCPNCTQASLACTFNKPPQKKGPKGSRAKVISELRKSQEIARGSSASGDGSGMTDPLMGIAGSLRTPGLLSPELVDACINYFFESAYPTLPIIDRKQMDECVADMSTSIEAYALISTVCSFIVIQPQIQLPLLGNNAGDSSMQQSATQGLRLLEEAVQMRKALNHVESPTLNAITTSFLMSACYFGLQRFNAAWYHLREAITLAQMLGMQDENTYAQSCVDGETNRRRRVYWILYVTERAQALQNVRPLTLHTTISRPVAGEDYWSDEFVAVQGLNCLINLFGIIDDTFAKIWNTARNQCTANWLVSLHQAIDKAIPPNLDCTEVQQADLRVTQQWLRTIVWQLSTASGCLSSTSAEYCMTFSYPIDVAKEVVSITSRLSKKSMETHGIGFIEKLFDIACTLVDVMGCVPTAAYDVGPREYLSHLLYLISMLKGGETRFVGLLQTKIDETIPSMSSAFAVPFASNHALEDIFKKEDSSESNASTPYNSPLLVVPETLRYSGLGAPIPMTAMPPGVPAASATSAYMAYNDNQMR